LPKLQKVINDAWRSVENESGGTSSSSSSSSRKKNPASILNMTLPNSMFDVNVSPDKREALLTSEDAICSALGDGIVKMWAKSREREGLKFVANEVLDMSSGSNGRGKDKEKEKSSHESNSRTTSAGSRRENMNDDSSGGGGEDSVAVEAFRKKNKTQSVLTVVPFLKAASRAKTYSNSALAKNEEEEDMREQRSEEEEGHVPLRLCSGEKRRAALAVAALKEKEIAATVQRGVDEEERRHHQIKKMQLQQREKKRESFEEAPDQDEGEEERRRKELILDTEQQRRIKRSSITSTLGDDSGLKGGGVGGISDAERFSQIQAKFNKNYSTSQDLQRTDNSELSLLTQTDEDESSRTKMNERKEEEEEEEEEEEATQIAPPQNQPQKKQQEEAAKAKPVTVFWGGSFESTESVCSATRTASKHAASYRSQLRKVSEEAASSSALLAGSLGAQESVGVDENGDVDEFVRSGEQQRKRGHEDDEDDDDESVNNSSSSSNKKKKKKQKTARKKKMAEKEKKKVSLGKSDFLTMEIIGQFNLGFILARCSRNNLWILDQHACDEKYNFERLCSETSVHEQKLIAPLSLGNDKLSTIEENCIIENFDIFEANGFKFAYDASKPPRSRLALTSLPHSGSGGGGRKAVQFGIDDVIALCALINESENGSESGQQNDYGGGQQQQLNNSGIGNNAVRRYGGGSEYSGVSSLAAGGKQRKGATIVRLPKAIAMFASRACRGSIMIGTSLSEGQMVNVVRKLNGVEQPWNCPHGRPTMRHVAELQEFLLEDSAEERENVAIACGVTMTQGEDSDDE
jgi:DNA mismatch repair ATPase MutL